VARSRSSAMAMAAVLPVGGMVRPRRPHLPLSLDPPTNLCDRFLASLIVSWL
jgi:hypothetical protein